MKKTQEAFLVAEPSDIVTVFGLVTRFTNLHHTTLLALMSTIGENKDELEEQLRDAVLQLRDLGQEIKKYQDIIDKFVDAVESEQP